MKIFLIKNRQFSEKHLMSNTLSRQRGLTLMELLLTIALISIVAAVTLPSFFVEGSSKIVQARIQMLKARYANIRAAFDLQQQDKAVLHPDYHADGSGPSTPVRRLVESGHLQPGSTFFEDAQGKERPFELRTEASSPVDAQLPPAIRTFKMHVYTTTAGDQSYDLDRALRIDNKSWQQIWSDLN
jgi:prepilin-type N-terminal cleavage/methylation domain-containing protein